MCVAKDYIKDIIGIQFRYIVVMKVTVLYMVVKKCLLFYNIDASIALKSDIIYVVVLC